MKFYKNQLPALINKIKNNEINSLLLYGPDKSGIQHIVKEIIEKLKLNKETIEYSDVNEDNFLQIANSNNFFAEQNIVIIANVTSNITKELSKLLKRKSNNFIIFIADDLTKSSKIRLLFEYNKENLAVIASYTNSEIENINIAQNEFAKHNIKISRTNLELFCSMVYPTIDDIKNEVMKLKYIIKDNIVTEENIKDIILTEDEINTDRLSFGLITKNAKIFYNEVENLKTSNIPLIGIIRSIGKYIMRAIEVKKSNTNFDVAVKKLDSPIFFKSLPQFKEVILNVQIKRLYLILDNLLEMEINIKKSIKHNNMLDKLFLYLS